MKEILKLILIFVCLLSLTFSPYHSVVKTSAIEDTLFCRQSVHGITNLAEGTNGVAIADFNRDGWMDILTTNSSRTVKGKKGSSTVRMFLNKGNGTYGTNECWIMNQSQFLSEGQLAPQIPNVVDFNKDGFLDIFITRQRGGINNINSVGNSLYLSQGKFDLFSDVSEKMGIQNKDAYNRASSIADIDGDGWLDIAVGADNIGNPDLAGKPESRLYLFKPKGANFEDGTFVDISNTELAKDFGGDFTCDYEKDKGGGPDIGLVDLDNDGDFDLVQSYHNDMLNTKPDNPCASAHFQFGVFVWKNLLKETGSFKLERITNNGLAEWGKLSYDPATQKVTIINDAVRLPYLSFGDINNDNFQDVLAIGPSFLSNQIELQKTRGKLWINDQFFKFHDVTKDAKIDSLTWNTKQWYEFQGWQADYPKNVAEQMIYGADAVFGDFNNDTYLDFIACDRREPIGTNFKPRNVLYLNNGDATFTPKPETFSGIDANSICAETADLNNDGLLDLFFAADPENTGGVGQKEDRYQDKIFLNTGSMGTNGNKWLKIRLDGLTDSEIMGARIEFLNQKNMSLICSRIVSSSHSYKSSSPMEVHGGLGKFDQVMVRVILPDSREFTFGNIATNQYLSFNLSSKEVKTIYQKKEAGPKKPNIILILTDDLDEKLGTMSYTPKLDKYIKQEGVMWEDFFISDTLCCPSRSTIARGQFVHNHGVLTNGLPGGGFDTFYARGNEDSTFATWLQEVGYETGFFGKYLNGYPFKDDLLHIPPGWSTWHSPSGGNPYSDFNYVMNENGKAVSYGSKPKDYLTDVIRDQSIDFIKQSKKSNKSFMVYLSPYVPHSPATPAPRHEDLFPDLKTPRIRSFNELDISDKPGSFQDRKLLTEKQIEEMDKFYRKRIQSMQAIDDMVEKVVLTLQEIGELENTYIFFTGDNGFHMGQHRLAAGKGTAYEEDISVPLYVRGPGIPKNKIITGFMGGNTDFASTFAEIAGATEPPFVDGRSLLPILHGANPTWRKAFFIEFYPFARARGTKPETLRNVESVLEPQDMDETMGLADNFSYIALRLPSAKYIEYKTGEKEYYDLAKDPYEMENAIKTLPPSKIDELSKWANALHKAKGTELRKLEEASPNEKFNFLNFLLPNTGLFQGSMDLNGSLRDYLIFIPSSYTGDKPYPVVFVFHGGGGTASGVIYETGWDKLAEEKGFIAVFPEGTRKDHSKPANFQTNPQSWNDGGNRTTNEAMIQNVDDSNFIRHMIHYLRAIYNIDENHIHATGFSNGASMSFRVGREVSDLFSSIAPVSGCDYLENKEGQHPISLFYITGTKDPLNSMEGGEIFIYKVSQGVKPPILEMLQKWVKKIEAPSEAIKVSESSTLETVKHYPGVNGTEIIFTSVKGLGHYWPGGKYQLPESILGSRENLNAMNATKEIWAFFETHPKKG